MMSGIVLYPRHGWSNQLCDLVDRIKRERATLSLETQEALLIVIGGILSVPRNG